MVRALAVFLVGAAVVVCGCSDDDPVRPAAPPVSTASSTSPRPTVPASTSTTRAAARPVTLAFAGDVHFEGALAAQLAANPAGVLSPIAGVLQSADLAMVNLETAITDRGSPEPKEFNFRAPAAAFTALRSGGIDVVTMANNHGVDYGPVGLADSLAAIRATRFPVVGIGADASHAYAPYIAHLNGQRIAVIGATQVLDNQLIVRWSATNTHPGLASAKDVRRLVQAVRAARAANDTVVVFLHWGVEGMTCPSQNQTNLAHAMIAAGADVVIGSHAHRLLGAGRLGRAFVDYGLGNFAFYTAGGPGTQTGVLFVTLTGRHVDRYAWQPATISGGVPRPQAGGAASAAVTAWNARRSCTGLTP